MGFLISFFAALNAILGFAAPVGNAIENILKRLGIYNKHAKGVSLADFAKNARVQPITVISKDLIALKELDSILLSVLNVFTAYYIQAFSVDSIKINGVSVDKILYKYNPNGSKNAFESFNQNHYSIEDYDHALPGTLSTEAHYAFRNSDKYNLPLTDNANREVEGNTLFKDDASLSVGKLINLNLTLPMATHWNQTLLTDRGNTPITANHDGEWNKDERHGITGSYDRDVVIPVLIQLSSVVLGTESVINLVASNSVDKTLNDRWIQYKSGQISFIKDLILCNDIIDEKKKLLMSDETDTYLNILKRIQKSQVGAIFSSEGLSFASASNIYVISESVAKEIEYRIGGKLSNYRTRNKLFLGNYGMILVVIDREWERVTFYYRNMEAGTDVSFSSLAKAGNKNTDIYEIFKMFNNGGSPIF